jgi:hypothetical protein
MYDRRLCLAIIFVLTVSSTTAPAASAAEDGATLAAQCAARDWTTYMNCQLKLLDVRAADSYCIPRPENAARYQYEFLVFMQGASSDLHDVAAETAAAAYFGHAYACPPPAR